MTHNIVLDRKITLAVSIRVPGHGWIDLKPHSRQLCGLGSCLVLGLGSSLGFADELSRRGYSSPINLCRSELSV
eukprot:scaffold12504_cov163-Skeletonema_dohrnii-CCMP3373.AAC.2